MQAILDWRATGLERVLGVAGALWLWDTITPDQPPCPELESALEAGFEAFMGQIGLPAFPMPPPPPVVVGGLYGLLKHGPFGHARNILGVVAPAAVCFMILPPKIKRAAVNPQRWPGLVINLAPKAAKGYVSIILPQFAAATFKHLMFPYMFGPNWNRDHWTLRDTLFSSEMQMVAVLFIRYWRPSNNNLVHGFPSGVLGLRALSRFSRDDNPRFWMFFDIAACRLLLKLFKCALFGPLRDLPMHACEGALDFVTAAVATRIDRALNDQ
ncbi:hypothetical protein PG999_010902 [Apiospora kogelbergensis]|uniref:Uncharacterized protein n=1 Tax=Apiospora kogelbergensis TaxID=1337665 RepID=A0AAW0QSE5_9PEZI